MRSRQVFEPGGLDFKIVESEGYSVKTKPHPCYRQVSCYSASGRFPLSTTVGVERGSPKVVDTCYVHVGAAPVWPAPGLLGPNKTHVSTLKRKQESHVFSYYPFPLTPNPSKALVVMFAVFFIAHRPVSSNPLCSYHP